MTIQFSDDVANGMLDSIESTIGTAPTMEIRSGSPPANCAASSTGTVLATLTLPSDWMAAAATRSKSKSGTWQDASADATGTAGYYRILVSGVCKIQGTCTGIGGGGDMIIDNPSLVATQQFTVVTYTITAPNP